MKYECFKDSGQLLSLKGSISVTRPKQIVVTYLAGLRTGQLIRLFTTITNVMDIDKPSCEANIYL